MLAWAGRLRSLHERALHARVPLESAQCRAALSAGTGLLVEQGGTSCVASFALSRAASNLHDLLDLRPHANVTELEVLDRSHDVLRHGC